LLNGKPAEEIKIFFTQESTLGALVKSGLGELAGLAHPPIVLTLLASPRIVAEIHSLSTTRAECAIQHPSATNCVILAEFEFTSEGKVSRKVARVG